MLFAAFIGVVLRHRVPPPRPPSSALVRLNPPWSGLWTKKLKKINARDDQFQIHPAPPPGKPSPRTARRSVPTKNGSPRRSPSLASIIPFSRFLCIFAAIPFQFAPHGRRVKPPHHLCRPPNTRFAFHRKETPPHHPSHWHHPSHRDHSSYPPSSISPPLLPSCASFVALVAFALKNSGSPVRSHPPSAVPLLFQSATSATSAEKIRLCELCGLRCLCVKAPDSPPRTAWSGLVRLLGKINQYFLPSPFAPTGGSKILPPREDGGWPRVNPAVNQPAMVKKQHMTSRPKSDDCSPETARGLTGWRFIRLRLKPPQF